MQLRPQAEAERDQLQERDDGRLQTIRPWRGMLVVLLPLLPATLPM